MSNASSVSKPTSTTPTIFRDSSTTGKARNRCRTNASHASSTVAVWGMATTRRIISSDNRRSNGAVRSWRVGRTPTKPFVRVHDVEINNFFADTALSDGVQRLLDGEILAQDGRVPAGDRQNRLMQMVLFICQLHV